LGRIVASAALRGWFSLGGTFAGTQASLLALDSGRVGCRTGVQHGASPRGAHRFRACSAGRIDFSDLPLWSLPRQLLGDPQTSPKIRPPR